MNNISLNSSSFLDKAMMSINDKTNTNIKKTKNEKEAEKTAKDFEAFFLTQAFSSMFEGIETDTAFGGGPAEKIYRSMLLNEYGKSIAASGGIGIADQVKSVILQAQEGIK